MSPLGMRSATVWANALLIVLRFDGSLRYPTDPGFSVSRSLGRMVAGAACIIVVSEQQPRGGCPNEEGAIGSSRNREQVVFAGGQLLDPAKVQTSAEAEYEGLLFGL
jgi:hypothetical protein